MDTIEVECGNCDKKKYVMGESVRDRMLCTLVCLHTYDQTLKTGAYRQ